MGNTTVGSTSGPTSGSTVNTASSAQWMSFETNTPGSDVWVDAIFVYAKGFNGTTTLYGCIWDNGSPAGLIASTPSGTSKSTTPDWAQMTWPTSSLVHLASGTAVRGGVYATSPGSGLQTNYPNGHYWYQGGASGPGTFTGGEDTWGFAGSMCWYLTGFLSVQATSVSQTPVGVGQTFTIGGRSFQSGVTGIVIHGAAGDVSVTTWTVDSDAQITATVPSGATNGTVTVTTNIGSVTSTQSVLVSNGFYKTGGVLLTSKGLYYKSGGVLHSVKGAWYKSGGVIHPIK